MLAKKQCRGSVSWATHDVNQEACDTQHLEHNRHACVRCVCVFITRIKNCGGYCNQIYGGAVKPYDQGERSGKKAAGGRPWVGGPGTAGVLGGRAGGHATPYMPHLREMPVSPSETLPRGWFKMNSGVVLAVRGCAGVVLAVRR